MSETNSSTAEPPKEETMVISTRLPRDLVEFLETTGEELSNSRNGIAEFGLKMFRDSYNAAKAAAANSGVPNPALAAAATLATRAA